MKNASVLIPLLILLAVAASGHAGDLALPEKARCVQCGMKCVPDSPFTAVLEVEGPDGSRLPFCDVGELLIHAKEHKGEEPGKYRVRDFHNLEWIDAEMAFYVKAPKYLSPMRWNIAAFKQRADASKEGKPMNFTEAMESLQ